MRNPSRHPLGQVTVRNLILCVALIVVVVLYESSWRSWHDSAPPFWPIALGVCVVVGGITFVAHRRWVARIDAGLAHYNAREFEVAAQFFAKAARRALAKSQRAVAELNLGLALLRLGRLEEALRHFQLAEDSQGFLGMAGMIAYHHALPNHLATCHALLGYAETAKQMLEEGERRRGKAPSNFALLPEVLVLCRGEHFAAAAAVLEKRWREAEASGVWELKMLRILQAFALDCADPARNAAAVAEALAGAKPFDAAAIRLLSTGWPKMQSFLEARQIRAQSAAA